MTTISPLINALHLILLICEYYGQCHYIEAEVNDSLCTRPIYDILCLGQKNYCMRLVGGTNWNQKWLQQSNEHHYPTDHWVG